MHDATNSFFFFFLAGWVGRSGWKVTNKENRLQKDSFSYVFDLLFCVAPNEKLRSKKIFTSMGTAHKATLIDFFEVEKKNQQQKNSCYLLCFFAILHKVASPLSSCSMSNWNEPVVTLSVTPHELRSFLPENKSTGWYSGFFLRQKDHFIFAQDTGNKKGGEGQGGTHKAFEGFNMISEYQDQHKEEAVELDRSLYLPSLCLFFGTTN